MKPYLHILAATDFSDTATRAAAQALRLAQRFGAKLTLVHVLEPFGHAVYMPAMFPGTLAELEREALRAVTARLGEQARELGHTGAVDVSVSPNAGLGVVEAARAHRADLIVVGTHGRTGLERLLIGSVATKVVRHSAVDVLTVPPSGTLVDQAGSCVLAASDLSHASVAGLRRAGWLGGRLDAETKIVHALNAAYLSPRGDDEARADARKRLEALASEAEIEADIDIVVGEHVVTALCDHADDVDAGVIVATRQGSDGLDRLLIGSVCERLVRHAGRPVLVTPPQSR